MTGCHPHVNLLFRLRPRAYDDFWDLSTPVTVEAGAELLGYVTAIESFFEAAP